MEEILNKDLFNEKDLKKYSPDYNPQNIFLRMQLRKDTVKDTHNHGVLRSSNCQKKNNMKTKSCYNMKKEIIKLHTYFRDKNLQNQCMLKDVENMNQKKKSWQQSNRAKSILNIENDELIGDEIAEYVNDSADDQANLIIENDSEFKLIKKEKCITLTTENIYNHKFNKNVVHQDKNINRHFDNNVSSEIVTVNKINPQIETKQEKVICNEYEKDLQSLLIMMTINSTMEENTELDDPTYIESASTISKINDFNIDVYDSKHRNDLSDKTEIGELITLLNIQPINKELNRRHKYIIKKYINLWKSFVNTKRETRMFEQRRESLNIFFDKLAKKKNSASSNIEPVQKSNIFARDYNTYRHRYKIQKHIIALQKAKLEEQNKVIEQLKYNKIVEASRQSLDTMREDVRKAYYEIDKHLKPKIKCMTNELKIKEFEEPSLVLHCLKVPQFLQRMEARAREREEKHAIIRERRKQMEEERIRLKQQAELAKAEMDKEEKIKRIKELREKRKREKVENIRKKQHAEKMRALIVMADLHYEKNLMAKFGIRPLKRLLEIKQDNMETAKAHYKFQLVKNIFLHWMWYTEDMWFDRNYKAENFYRKKVLKKYFSSFKKNHYEFVLKKQVAEDYYDLYVTQLVFRNFRKSIVINKKEFEIKWTKAIVYYNGNILFKTFTCWRSLPALNALKREQDARKMKWRQKVLLVVPDYNPPED